MSKGHHQRIPGGIQLMLDPIEGAFAAFPVQDGITLSAAFGISQTMKNMFFRVSVQSYAIITTFMVRLVPAIVVNDVPSD